MSILLLEEVDLSSEAVVKGARFEGNDVQSLEAAVKIRSLVVPAVTVIVYLESYQRWRFSLRCVMEKRTCSSAQISVNCTSPVSPTLAKAYSRWVSDLALISCALKFLA